MPEQMERKNNWLMGLRSAPTWVKRLLYALLIAALLTGGAFLVVPTACRLSDQNAQIDRARAEQSEMDRVISNGPTAETDLGILKKGNAKLAAEFNVPMSTEAADKLVTGLIRSNGLTPKSLEIGTFELFSTEKQTETQTEKQRKTAVPNSEKDLEEQSLDDGEAASAVEGVQKVQEIVLAGQDPIQDGELRVCKLTATMSGPMTSFRNLVAQVDEKAGVRIVEFSSKEVVKPVSADVLAQNPFGAQSETETIYTVLFEIITYEPPNDAGASNESEELPTTDRDPSSQGQAQGGEGTGGSFSGESGQNNNVTSGGSTGQTQQNTNGGVNTGNVPGTGTTGNTQSSQSDSLETGDDPNSPLWNRD